MPLSFLSTRICTAVREASLQMSVKAIVQASDDDRVHALELSRFGVLPNV